MSTWQRSVIFFLWYQVFCSASDPPNILFVLIDDIGWNDVSYHGGSDFDTPNLDTLANDGLQLTNYYVQHFCTPTRSALMSGRYPMRDGLQQRDIRLMAPYGMPLDVTTLPEELKSVGYHTHLLGKWHLGYFDEKYTPTFRGFDSFLGYYGDKEDYYYKNVSYLPRKNTLLSNTPVTGHDFRNNTSPFLTHQYSTYLYGNETLRIMQQHVEINDDDDEKSPFFILLSSQAARIPFDAPQQFKQRYDSLIIDSNRQQMAAVLAVFDETLGNMVRFLKSEESGYLWDDTLIIVSTDNGGNHADGHSNFPLRGGWSTLWEGGLKATAFITGGWLPDDRRGQQMNALMHVTDWLPTLVSIAGFAPSTSSILDGYDQSTNIVNVEQDLYAPRQEILHNILPQGVNQSLASCYSEFCGAIRWRDYKLVIGVDSIMNASMTTSCDNTWCDTAVAEDASTSIQCIANGNNGDFPVISEDDCLFNGAACLFNVMEDPCEWNDISMDESVSDIVEMLTEKLKEYNEMQMYPLYREYESDPDPSIANPDNFGGFWAPWRFEKEHDKSKHHGAQKLNWHLIAKLILIVAATFIVMATCFFCVYRWGGTRCRISNSRLEYTQIGGKTTTRYF